MRSISAELLAAQQGSYPPYIDLVFHDRDDNNTEDFSLATDSTNRIIDILHAEKMWDGYAFIVLRNNDLTIPDLRGWWVEIGYGADTSNFGGSGNESEKTARLWVTNQQYISAPGRQEVVLILEDIWRRWARHEVITKGVAPYYNYAWNGIYDENGIPTQGDTATVYAIFEWLVETNLAQNIRPYMAGTLDALGGQNDGIIARLTPYIAINQHYIEPALEIIQRIFGYTKSYPRARKSINFEIRYPQDSDAVDATYYSDQVPFFHEYVETASVLAPNVITFWGDANPDGTWSAGVMDFAPIDVVGDNEEKVIKTVALPDVHDEGELADYVDAYHQRIKNRRVAGRMIIRHDCRLEIHDKIEIIDSRGV